MDRSSDDFASAGCDVDAVLADLRARLAEDGETPGEHDDLIEWGLDSITLMSTAAGWRRAGLDVQFGELAATPTLAAWRTLLAAGTRTTTSGDTARSARRVGESAPASRENPPGESGRTPRPGEPFALAPLQHAYWIGRQDGQRLGGVAAHLYTEFDGPELDPDRLRAAVAAVLRRHPMLRMTVTGDGTQRVRPERARPALTVTDLRTVADPEPELAAQRDRRSHQRLDIEDGEVFDLALTRLPGGRSRLHLDVDMVAADARSYRVLLADLARAYAGQDLPDAAGYDFARYLDEHAAATATAAGRAREWWQPRLAELPGPPELPADPGHTADPGRTGRRARWLDPALRERLTVQARRHGVTLAMALAGAYAEVLGGWSGPGRFLLNVPLFDREPLHPEVAGLVGDFTSSVLLDVDVRTPTGFAERARGLQSQLHERAGHAAFGGVDVLRELTRARGEQVVAPVVFTSALGLGELFDAVVREQFGTPVWILSQGPQVLLDAQVTELDGGVLVNWDVRENLLAPGVADAMFAAFTGLVDRLAAGDEAWARPVTELLDAGQRAVRNRVNTTRVPDEPARLHDGFFAHAATDPDAPALLWGPADAGWSYRELADRALRVAAALHDAGVRPGDTVAVRLPKGPEQVASVLGTLAAGATYLPIGWDAPTGRVARILTLSGARAILGPGAGPGCVHLDPDTALAWPHRLPEPVPGDPHDIGYLLFTSGSTGEPKGVEVPHAAAMNTIADLLRRYRIGPRDRALGVSAMEFDLSVFDVFGLLSAGGTVVVVREAERGDARAWAELVRGRGVTVLNCVPALLDMLLLEGLAGGLGTSLRLVLLGGDWVGVDLPGRLAEQLPDCRFVGLGGTTETAIHSTECEVTGGRVPEHWRSVPYGSPLDNVVCRVVDEQGRDRPDWAIGELWIGGGGVAAGYRGDPERTAERFREVDGVRWYRTGDLARYWRDGTCEFLGRADHQVKLRGYRVELGEVEAALAAVPGARRAVARVGARRGGTLEALVAGDTGLDEAALRAGVADVLPGYMVPDRILVRDELPLTRNGKPDRAAVDALLDAAGATGRGPAEPETALQRLILSVWRAVLADDRLGVHDEFLAAGGDSVLATRIVAGLREALQSDGIRVRDVFTARTVAELATALTADDPRWEEIATIALEVAALTDDELDLELRN